MIDFSDFAVYIDLHATAWVAVAEEKCSTTAALFQKQRPC